MPHRIGFARLLYCALLALVCGCTSLQTFRFDEVNPEMPVQVGDEVRIYLYDAQPGGADFRVTAVTDQAISVRPIPGDDARQVTYRWDQIARIDARQFDAGKTTILVVLGLLLVDAVGDLGESLEDLFDIFSRDD